MLISTRFSPMIALMLLLLLLQVHKQPVTAHQIDYRFRVYKGVEARLGQCLYHVGLINRVSNTHTCGGSIIGQRRVLTAAHCVEHGHDQIVHPADMFAVRAGSNALLKLNSSQALYTAVERITVHPWRNVESKLYDVAVLQTADNLFDERTMHRQPIALASRPIPVGSVCTVCGWGTTETDALRDELLFVRVSTTAIDECAKVWQRNISSDRMCAAGLDGRDAGHGDGGGGLVHNRRLVGVVSFGRGFGEGKPTVYTSVWTVREWAIDGDPTALAGAGDLRPWMGEYRIIWSVVVAASVWWTLNG